MNYAKIKKEDLITEHKSIVASMAKKEADLESMKLELASSVANAKTQALVNTNLREVIQQIIDLINSIFKEVSWPTRISWLWVLMNIRSVIKLVLGIIDILKNNKEI